MKLPSAPLYRPAMGPTAVLPRFGADQPVGPGPTFKQKLKTWVKAGMPLTRVTKQNRRTIPQQIKWASKVTLLSAVLGYGSTLGLSALYDKTIGDGAIPDIAKLPANQAGDLMRNSTDDLSKRAFSRHFGPKVTPVEVWERLQPVLNRLKTVNPQAYAWVLERHQKRGFVYRSNQSQNGIYSSIAEHDPYSGNLLIYPDFLDMEDGYKIGILCHEYRHARQNWGKRITEIFNPFSLYHIYSTELLNKPSKFLGIGEDDYGNPREDEAHLYEYQAYTQMGIPPRPDLVDYLQNRKLLPDNQPVIRQRRTLEKQDAHSE